MNRDLPNSTHGHRKARQLAQERADAVGRRVYLQTIPYPYPSERMCALIADDGRGPFELGRPWREYWPRPHEQTP